MHVPVSTRLLNIGPRDQKIILVSEVECWSTWTAMSFTLCQWYSNQEHYCHSDKLHVACTPYKTIRPAPTLFDESKYIIELLACRFSLISSTGDDQVNKKGCQRIASRISKQLIICRHKFILTSNHHLPDFRVRKRTLCILDR